MGEHVEGGPNRLPGEPPTALEFDYQSEVEGQGHAIVDNDLSMLFAHMLQLHGSDPLGKEMGRGL